MPERLRWCAGIGGAGTMIGGSALFASVRGGVGHASCWVTEVKGMDHATFVQRVGDPSFLWGVRCFHRATFTVWGWRSWSVWVCTLVIVMPTLLVSVYAVSRGELLACLWSIPCLLGVLAGKPNLNGIGLIFFVALGGTGYFLLPRTGWYALACVVPVFGYFAMGAHKGMTMIDLQNEVSRSQRSYDLLRDRGLLLIIGDVERPPNVWWQSAAHRRCGFSTRSRLLQLLVV